MAALNTSSLQSLVAQLASFETAFINILTQAALSMSDLAGRELFLLCRSQTGTYYAGSDALCQAYKTGTLISTSEEELHIKKEEPCRGLCKRPINSSISSIVSRKRSPSRDSPSASPAKKPSVDDLDDLGFDHSLDVKSEVTDPSIAIAMDDDDDDIIWEDPDDGDLVGQLGAHCGPGDPGPRPHNYYQTLREPMDSKIQRLKSLQPEQVFVKRSDEHQLLSNVMYGFGRDLAMQFAAENRNRPEDDKLKKAEYFNDKYPEFVKQFPELTGFKTRIKKTVNQIVSAAMYIKNIAQKAFYKRVKKEEEAERQTAAGNKGSRTSDSGPGLSSFGCGGQGFGGQGFGGQGSRLGYGEQGSSGLIDPKTGMPSFASETFDDDVLII